MIRRFLNWVRDTLDLFEDFGPYGVLMRDPVTDEFRPMLLEDFKTLNINTRLLHPDGWRSLELEAEKIHGPAILRPQ